MAYPLPKTKSNFNSIFGDPFCWVCRDHLGQFLIALLLLHGQIEKGIFQVIHYGPKLKWPSLLPQWQRRPPLLNNLFSWRRPLKAQFIILLAGIIQHINLVTSLIFNVIKSARMAYTLCCKKSNDVINLTIFFIIIDFFFNSIITIERGDLNSGYLKKKY